MSFVTTSTLLAAAVANLGTFTVAYPAGSNGGDFVGGVDHRLIVGQREFRSPADFTVAFGPALATITWKGGFGLTQAQQVRVQFDKAGFGNSDVARSSVAPLLRIDLGTPATAAPAALRASAAIAAGGNVPLLAAGKTFDIPRNITVTSAGAEVGMSITFTGVDEYGAALTETIVAGATTTVNGKKAFKTVNSAVASGASVAAISAGFGTVLGLPIFLATPGMILAELVDNAAATAGTKLAGLAANTASTATTADVRGTWTPAGAQLPNGARAYSLLAVSANPTFLGNTQA